MGAQHERSANQLIQSIDNKETSLSREQTKINVVQRPRGPNIHKIEGRGRGSVGTVYPINAPIDDRGTVSDASINIAIPNPKHHYVKMNLNNANPTINFINLIVGQTTTFTLDLTNSITLSSLTFSPSLVNAPTIDLGIAARNVLHIVAHRSSSETRYEVIGGGGAGISFPITPPISSRGSVSTNQDIDLSANNAHVTKMTLTGNISITFSNYPASGNQIEWEVEITQDSTGGRTVTWPAALVNTPNLSTAPSTTSIIVFRTNDGGTTVRSLTSTITSSGGGGGDPSLWANFAAVANIDANNNDILQVKNIDMDDVNSTISGIKNLVFYDDDPNKKIVSTTSAIEHYVPSTEEHTFYTGGTKVFSVNQQGVGQPAEIQLFQSSIEDSGEILFTTSSDAIIGNTEPGMGYIASGFDMVWNIPTNVSSSYQWKIDSTTKMVLSLSGSNSDLTVNNISNLLQLGLGDAATDPAAAGIFTRNGVDVKVYSGGAVRNFTNIPTSTPANTTLSNLTSPTAINQSLKFNAATYEIGDSTNSVKHLFAQVLRLYSGTGITNIPNIYSATGSSMDINVPTGATIVFREQGTSKWTMTASQLQGTIFRGQNFLLDNSSTYPIINGSFRMNGTIVALHASEYTVRRTTSDPNENATINITKVDDTPLDGEDIGLINFKISDSGVEKTYGQIGVGNLNVSDNSYMAFKIRADNLLEAHMSLQGDDNNRTSMLLLGINEARIQPTTGKMAYFVTNQVVDFSLVIGTGGSLEIPKVDQASPSVTDLNQAYGAFEGSIGYNQTTGRLYVRRSDGDWDYFEKAGTVT